MYLFYVFIKFFSGFRNILYKFNYLNYIINDTIMKYTYLLEFDKENFILVTFIINNYQYI